MSGFIGANPIADTLKATEALQTAVPLLSRSTSEKDYQSALELIEYLLLNDPENPLVEIVSSKSFAWENAQPDVQGCR